MVHRHSMLIGDYMNATQLSMKQKKPILKHSYENNPDVQCWPQEQALDDVGARSDRTRPRG